MNSTTSSPKASYPEQRLEVLARLIQLLQVAWYSSKGGVLKSELAC